MLDRIRRLFKKDEPVQIRRPDTGESAEPSIFTIMDSFPYANPDDLVGRKGGEIYEKIFNGDPEAAASHEELIFGVSSVGHRIKPSDSDNSLAVEMADFVDKKYHCLGRRKQKRVHVQSASVADV